MPSRTLDAEIDRLYQLPLDEFTSARNALAKEAGSDAARVRGLAKPSVPAWIVNQLYWSDRKTWDALISAAENARKVNRAVLAGKNGDVRAANAVHDEAVETAFKAALALLSRSGHPATDATRQAIATTLRALPADEAPGRLTRPIQPSGFEAFAGVSVAPTAKKPAQQHTQQKQAEASAARELKDAETAARRVEFEKARLERESRRSEAALERAQEAVERANADLERARRDAHEAVAASRAAAERARKAQEDLARLKKR